MQDAAFARDDFLLVRYLHKMGQMNLTRLDTAIAIILGFYSAMFL
jgi:hypothetical protein